MKKLLFGLIATVLFGMGANANNCLGKPKFKKDEIETVGKGKIIKYVVAAIDWIFGGDDDPETVSATGAYKDKTCDARNTNTCTITFSKSNTKAIDIRNINSSTTALLNKIMKKVDDNDFSFMSIDEYGSLYLTSHINTKDKLFTSGEVTQTVDANIDKEVLDYLNQLILEINPKAELFNGIRVGKKLIPEVDNEKGLIYIKLN